MHAWLCLCMHVCVGLCVRVAAAMLECLPACPHWFTCASVCACACVRVPRCVCVCVYVCVCVCDCVRVGENVSV